MKETPNKGGTAFKSSPVRAVDLFCGIGGMTHGFQRVGIPVIAGIDNDLSCAHGYEANNHSKFIHKDIAEVAPDDLKALFEGAQVKVLIGCAPCQPYSGLNPRTPDARKMMPLEKFAYLIEAVQPDIVSMENVRGLANEGKYPVFRHFIQTLEKNGYKYSYQVIDTSKYGVPQKRHRLVLLASKHGEISLIPPTHQEAPLSVRDVIGDLPHILDGEICSSDLLHRTPKLTEINKKRIKATPANGGDSHSWSEDLVLECHKKASGKTYKSTVYGRMSWDQPAPTMTTQCIGLGNGRFGHPEQDRAISLREAARIQSFPDNYIFCDMKKISKKQVAKFIGNAVPVRLGEVIAQSIQQHLSTKALLKASY